MTFNKKLVFFTAFPLVFDCLVLYGLSITVTHSAFFFTILKIIMFGIPFMCCKNIRALSYMYALFVYIPSLMNVLHMLMMHAEMNACSLYIMLASNPSEIQEFIQHFFSYKIMLCSAIFAIVIYLFIKFSRAYRQQNKFSQRNKVVLLSVFFMAYFGFAFGNSNYSNSFDKIIRAMYEYNRDRLRNRRIIQNRDQINYGKVSSEISDDMPQTYIVVFGESVDRKHMSLYGYNRVTTPNFNGLRSELKVFDNVRSSFASTILALKGSLAFDNDINKGDIVSFLNKAGFKTFWISNQFVIERDDGIFNVEAELATGFSVFKNASHQRGSRQSMHDDCLLEPLKVALKEPDKKKVIFIHLLGSHIYYSQRYPKSYDKFTSPGMTRRAREVAEYDNSILYTDYVLSQIIDLLKTRKGEVSFMLYISDHGEDCYDCEGSIHTHFENKECDHMYEIPAVIWLSDEYKDIRKDFIDSWNLHKPYKTRNMIHSILDLIGLNNEFIDKKRSLFR